MGNVFIIVENHLRKARLRILLFCEITTSYVASLGSTLTCLFCEITTSYVASLGSTLIENHHRKARLRNLGSTLTCLFCE